VVQTSRADFAAGTASGVSVNQNGTVSLGSAVYDDFDDNSIDPGRWTRQETARPLADRGEREAQGLRQPGHDGLDGRPACSRPRWSARYRRTSSVHRLGELLGTSLGLWQDDQNSIVIAEHYDWTGATRGWRWRGTWAGPKTSSSSATWTAIRPRHNFKAVYSGGTMTFTWTLLGPTAARSRFPPGHNALDQRGGQGVRQLPVGQRRGSGDGREPDLIRARHGVQPAGPQQREAGPRSSGRAPGSTCTSVRPAGPT